MKRCNALQCYGEGSLHVVACELMKEYYEEEKKKETRKGAEKKAVDKINSIIFKHTGLR